MTPEPHHPQVQERGRPPFPHPRDRLQRGVVGLRQVATVGREVAEPRAVAVSAAHPAFGRAHADTQAVVLADQQQGQRQPLAGAVAGGVDGAGRGRVVDRGVAEVADDHSVGGPGAGDAEPLGPLDCEGRPDRAWQVGGDRRGLRDHGKVGMAEDLMAAARDRLLGRGDDAKQHVAQGLLSGHLPGPLQVEGAGAVVQQRGVGSAQGCGNRSIAFVTCRGDGVEALALATQPARREVEVAAGELRVEQLKAACPGERGALPDRQPMVPGRPWRQRRDGLDEVGVDHFQHPGLHLPCEPCGPCQPHRAVPVIFSGPHSVRPRPLPVRARGARPGGSCGRRARARRGRTGNRVAR